MDTKAHWEKVYSTKAAEAVSWYCAHLDTSLALIERAATRYSSSITMSPMHSSNAALMMYGTTVRCFIFLLQASTVLRMFDRSATPSSLAAM